jgi:hypothetical protein
VLVAQPQGAAWQLVSAKTRGSPTAYIYGFGFLRIMRFTMLEGRVGFYQCCTRLMGVEVMHLKRIHLAFGCRRRSVRHMHSSACSGGYASRRLNPV